MTVKQSAQKLIFLDLCVLITYLSTLFCTAPTTESLVIALFNATLHAVKRDVIVITYLIGREQPSLIHAEICEDKYKGGCENVPIDLTKSKVNYELSTTLYGPCKLKLVATGVSDNATTVFKTFTIRE